MIPLASYSLDQMQTFFYLVLVMLAIVGVVGICGVAGLLGLPAVWRAGHRLTAVLAAAGLVVALPFLLGAFWVLFAVALGPPH